MSLCHIVDWHGVLFIRQGLYQEGIFKFSVQIPENYPDGDAPVSSNFQISQMCTHARKHTHTHTHRVAQPIKGVKKILQVKDCLQVGKWQK